MKYMDVDNKVMKLLYPFANVMCLFFPIGKLENGGTCEFASEECLKKCCANKPGSAFRKGYKEMRRDVFNYFLNNSPGKITSRILIELEDVNCNIFSWFSSGDCPEFLTSKYISIVAKIDAEGIIQTGFTRNRRLWLFCKNHLTINARILLTVENINNISQPGIYSVPDYELGCINIWKLTTYKKYVTEGCGGGFYKDHIRKSGKDQSHLELDCKACHQNNTGCFMNFQKEIKNNINT